MSLCVQSYQGIWRLCEVARNIGYRKSSTPLFIWSCWIAARVSFGELSLCALQWQYAEESPRVSFQERTTRSGIRRYRRVSQRASAILVTCQYAAFSIIPSSPLMDRSICQVAREGEAEMAQFDLGGLIGRARCRSRSSRSQSDRVFSSGQRSRGSDASNVHSGV